MERCSRPSIRFLALVGLLLVGTAGCEAGYVISVNPELHPRMSATDAARITLAYLARQTPEIADPEQHIAPRIASVSLVLAGAAPAVDGCIPAQSSADLVWVTKGVGDYLNLRDLPWSRATTQANADTQAALTCGGPGPAGTIVIDDASGAILGVYPEDPDFFPHPTGPG
jgi:hypothetical protein